MSLFSTTPVSDVTLQYNTCFWALVRRGGRTPAQAQEELKGSDAEFKNELLFNQFGINYNTLPEQFKKVGGCSPVPVGILGGEPHASEGAGAWIWSPIPRH